MSVLDTLDRFFENIFQLIAYAIVAFILGAIWAVGFFIDMLSDILEWINNRIESMLTKGVSDVTVVKGSALADFIKTEKQSGKYPEISLDQLNAMNKSVINIVTDKNGKIIDDQMIRSNGGLSQSADAQFNGQPILSIKIPA